MDKNTVLKIIERFKTLIENRCFKIEKIILFGSYARGDNNKTSDIDIILISQDFVKLDYWKRIDLISEIIYEIFQPLDVFLYTPAEWEKNDSFIIDYANDGEIIYAA